MFEKGRVVKVGGMDQALLETLAYSDIFSFPLTTQEVHRYLISDKQVSISRVEKGLKKLLAEKKVSRFVAKKEAYWSISQAKQKTAERFSRKKFSHQKLNKTRSTIDGLSKIPWITAVFLTGSISMMSAQKYDDIDVFIVTKPNRLWLVRIFVVTYLELRQKRRKPESGQARNNNNLICANLLLDEKHLQLPVESQSLYSAHEVVQAKIVFDRSNIEQQFLHSNSWIADYLPNSPLPCHQKHESVQTNTLLKFGNICLTFLDRIAYGLQRLYMEPKKTSEKVGVGFAYFHPRNTTNQIMSQYQQKIKSYS